MVKRDEAAQSLGRRRKVDRITFPLCKLLVEIKHQQPWAGLLLALQNFICCEKKLVLYQIPLHAEITFVVQFSTFSINFTIQKTDF